jgi:isopenicillin-N N-acyltransferase like protein
VLEAHPDDGLSFVTIVEAGLLAKMGMNAAGVALVTNGLATRLDVGEPGVPYHVLLRRVLECAGVEEAVAELERAPRASSGNYLIASAEGAVVDVEAWASGPGTTCELLTPRDGVLVHTNHCVAVPADRRDMPFELTDTSAPRLARAQELLREPSGKLTVEDLKRALCDHERHPLGVCTHLDLDAPEFERFPTLASLIMEPETRRMLLAEGNPCQATCQELNTTALAAAGTAGA